MKHFLINFMKCSKTATSSSVVKNYYKNTPYSLPIPVSTLFAQRYFSFSHREVEPLSPPLESELGPGCAVTN